MSESSTRPLVVTLPLAVYDALVGRAQRAGVPVEAMAGELLAEVVRFGSPGERYLAAQLASQAVDLLSAWRRCHLARLIRLSAEAARIARALDHLDKGR